MSKAIEQNQADIDAEQALLGSILTDGRQWGAVSGEVESRDFLDSDLGKLWDLIGAMEDAGDPWTDIVILGRAAKRIGIESRLLARLIGSGVAFNASYYAKAVRTGGRRRRALAGLLGALESIRDGRASLDDGMAEIEAIIQRERDCRGDGWRMLSEYAEEWVETLREKPAEAIVFTGLPTLDMRMGGMGRGELVVLAARPGVGKTALVSQIAVYNADRGRPGLVISIEMTGAELANRILCGEAGVDNKTIRSGRIKPEEIDRMSEAAIELRRTPVLVWEAARVTLPQVIARAKLAKMTHGIQWVAIDYLGLIRQSGQRIERREHIGECTRGLKALAKELQVPVVLLAQLNRQGADGEPQLHHLAESGDVERDADMVLFLHPDEDPHVKLIVAKNRGGETGFEMLSFDKVRTRFREQQFTNHWQG